MGRQSQVSNPYPAASSPVNWTTYTYDTQSRVIQVTAPDGSTSKTFYNETSAPSSAASNTGNTVRSQDAWGRERWARSDAFGRLTEVVEPDANGTGGVFAYGNMQTAYSYDELDQLTQVNQGVQVRKFKYDSLGRMTRQKLAEQTATINDVRLRSFDVSQGFGCVLKEDGVFHCTEYINRYWYDDGTGGGGGGGDDIPRGGRGGGGRGGGGGSPPQGEQEDPQKTCDQRLGGLFGGIVATKYEPKNLERRGGADYEYHLGNNGALHTYGNDSASTKNTSLFLPLDSNGKSPTYLGGYAYDENGAGVGDSKTNVHRWKYTSGLVIEYFHVGGTTESKTTDRKGHYKSTLGVFTGQTNANGSLQIGYIGGLGGDGKFIHSHLNFKINGKRVDPRKIFCKDLGF